MERRVRRVLLSEFHAAFVVDALRRAEALVSAL
jgi:hypothetical protein